MLHTIMRWVSRHRRLLMVLPAACIAVAFISLQLTASPAKSGTVSSPIPAAAVQHLSSVAEQAAKAGGDAKPAWVQAAMMSRDNALRVATPGDTIPGSQNQVVYLVVMKGNFTLNNAPAPPHAHAPTGHYLTLTFSTATFQIADLGLTDTSPLAALRSLGPASTLTLPK
jgi:hypothetical protein